MEAGTEYILKATVCIWDLSGQLGINTGSSSKMWKISFWTETYLHHTLFIQMCDFWQVFQYAAHDHLLTQGLCRNLPWHFGEYRAVLACCRLVALKWVEYEDCKMYWHALQDVYFDGHFIPVIAGSLCVCPLLSESVKCQPGANSRHVYKVSSTQGWGGLLHLFITTGISNRGISGCIQYYIWVNLIYLCKYWVMLHIIYKYFNLY
jgi:hypothetical protein